MSGDRLTGKQSRFVDEYIVCLNGTEAARRAGYSGDDRALAVIASQNLRKLNISRAIDARLQEFAMPANEVLAQLTDIGRGDVADLLSETGRVDILEAKRRGKSHLVKRIREKVTTITEKDGKETEIVETEIELYDRQSAINTLAKYHALLVDRVKVEDWRSDIITLYRAGKITREQIEAELGTSLAQELFESAGIPIVSS